MKKMIAGALFGLVVLGANRAEANKKITLTVKSCDAQGQPWKQTDQDGRMGRLRIKDQGGQTLQTEVSVHFSASRCQATFTSSFTDATLARFVDPDDPLFLTLEACKNGQATCTFLPTAQLDDKPVVFQDSPLDSLLPEIHKLLSDDIDAAAGAAAAAIAAEAAARAAAVQAEANARAAAVQAEAQARAAADQAEQLRAMAAEQAAQGGLAAEVTRAMAAELAEESARQAAIAAEAQARADAIAAEAQARADAIAAEADARTAADEGEALARATADSDEATTRAAGDQEVKDYADGKFLPMAGGTVDGELVVNGMLRLNGGVSWDSCPAGLDSLEHEFGGPGGGSNRLCASAMQTTEPSVQINEVLGSYIAPICPMVTQVVANYVDIGGEAAIEGLNTLLGQVAGLLNDQITPFANGLIGATTGVTNQLIDGINGKITDINGLIAANTATLNSVIDAYNGLVAKVNTALSSSTGGLNTSITAINDYLSAVRNDINGVVTGTNLAVGDVNAAFAAINTSLGNTSNALNTFNSSPSGINTALGTLTTSLNGQITTLNGLLDSITAAQNALTGSVNNAITGLNAAFGSVTSAINTVSGGLRGTISNVNNAINVLDGGAINVGNYLVNLLNNEIIGAASWDNSTKGINGGLTALANYTVGIVNLPWVPQVGTISSTTATGHSIGGWLYTINSPSVAAINAPAAIGHVSTVSAPTISSLGLPTFNLGLNASMRTISHDLGAPALGSVNAPQIAGANLSSVAAAAIPPIPHVQIPAIPAWGGFELEVDIEAVSGVIETTMDPICDDIEATAQTYLDAFLGEVPALVPDFADAEDVCGDMGAHVCGPTEIALLAGDNRTPEQIGYGFGDWTGPGRVMFNQAAKSGLMLDVDWPFLHPDASKLMTFPPGFPFTFTPPVLPTGNFRCCASSASVE